MRHHHERDEGVDAEDETEHGRTDEAHDFEVDLADQRASVRGRSQGAEDGDLVADIWSLLLGQRDEGLGGALAVSDERKLWEARLLQHAVDEGWQVENTHLSNVPCPHARVAVVEESVAIRKDAEAKLNDDIVAKVQNAIEQEDAAARKGLKRLMVLQVFRRILGFTHVAMSGDSAT